MTTALVARRAQWTAPAIALVLLTIALWVAFGVSPSDIALFCGYQLVFLIAPGCLTYLALAGRWRSTMRSVSIGVALGYAIEILAFAVTAGLHVRALLAAYPVIVCLLALAAITGRARRRRGTQQIARPTMNALTFDLRMSPEAARAMWITCGVIGLVFVYVAIVYFSQTPLPDRSGFDAYYPDLTFHLDLGAEPLHHWPMRSPQVAGAALPYQLFVYMHLAATAQVTGIGLPTLLFRLLPLPILILFVIQVCWATRCFTGQVMAGPLAAGLILLVGEVNPVASHFTESRFDFIWLLLSPTALLGLTLFLPALVLIAERLRIVGEGSRDSRWWLVITPLLLACGGAKGSILPVLLGGLVLYAIAAWWRDRRFPRETVSVFLLILGCLLATDLAIYRGYGEGLTLSSSGTADMVPALANLMKPFRHLPVIAPIFWFVANSSLVFVLAGASLVGLICLIHEREARTAGVARFLLTPFVAGLVPLYFWSAIGFSELWFAYFGFVPAAILSAHGLLLFWRRLWRASEGRSRRVWLYLGIALAVVAAVSVAAARLKLSNQWRYLVWITMMVALLGAAAVGARRTRGGDTRSKVAWLVLPLLVLGLLDIPLHTLPELLETGSEPFYANHYGYLPSSLVGGLRWLRDHTSPNALVAVNNYTDPSDSAFAGQPFFMAYSALSERRVFLEGWTETAAILGLQGSDPFAARRRINDAVFQHANGTALATMRRSGVDFLLVDGAHAPANPGLWRLGRRVYARGSTQIYAVAGLR